MIWIARDRREQPLFTVSDEPLQSTLASATYLGKTYAVPMTGPSGDRSGEVIEALAHEAERVVVLDEAIGWTPNMIMAGSGKGKDPTLHPVESDGYNEYPHQPVYVFALVKDDQGDNEQHGWVGIRFQIEPGAPPSQVLLHINLCDPTAQLQQQAIGILGVNLIYAAYYQRAEVDLFLSGLYDELSIDRIEIDVIELDGPAFTNRDAHAWCLALLGRHMSHAIVFDTRGRVVEPSSLLRKRPLLVMRGTFKKAELLDPAPLESAGRMLVTESGPFEREPVALTELSIHHVTRVEQVSLDRMLESIRQLTPRGPVVASDYPETYLLTRYLRRHSVEPVRFVLSVAAAAKILNETFYQNLPGTLLEGLGRLLATHVKVYVAPMPRKAFAAALGDTSGRLAVGESDDTLVALDDLIPAEPACHLLKYLRAASWIVPLQEG
jgi:hypothetical protein